MAPGLPTALDRPHFIGIGGAGMSGIAKILAQRGAKVAGSRFYYLTGIGMRLELAIMLMGLDQVLAHWRTVAEQAIEQASAAVVPAAKTVAPTENWVTDKAGPSTSVSLVSTLPETGPWTRARKRPFSVRNETATPCSPPVCTMLCQRRPFGSARISGSPAISRGKRPMASEWSATTRKSSGRERRTGCRVAEITSPPLAKR